jgi:hypothetical protein
MNGASHQSAQAALSGPLDDENQFPDVIKARVVTVGAQPRVRGYDVEGDLAQHYNTADLTLLALTSELPTEPARRAFEVASLFLAPVAVNEAATHAAVVTKLFGAKSTSVLAIAAIGLAEQARAVVDEHAALLDALKAKRVELESRYRATCPADRDSVAQLRNALPPELEVPTLTQDPTRIAALLAIFYACGLRRREQWEAALVHARLPCVLAEAMSERATNFGNYPINLPAFSYRSET